MLPYLNHRTRAPGNSYHMRKPCSLHSMKKKASHSVNYKIFVCTYMYVYSAVGSNIDSSFYQNFFLRASLAVQWLRLHASNAGDMGWIPGRGTKIPHASRCSKKKKKSQNTRLFLRAIFQQVLSTLPHYPTLSL